ATSRQIPCGMAEPPVSTTRMRLSPGQRKLRFVTPSRRSHSRGLTMPPGRRIPRPPDTRPERPPLPENSDTVVTPDVVKAAGELITLATAIRACEACGRSAAARALGTGYPRALVMLVKDAPSPPDLESGNAFSDEAEALTKAFEALSIPIAWVYATTAVRCGDGTPGPDELRACSAHLVTEIEA